MNIFLILIRSLVKCHFWLFNTSPKLPPDRSNISGILISVSGGIGDALMAQPLVHALHERLPELPIDILASPATEAIFQDNPDVRKVLLIENRTFSGITKLIRLLRKEQYDFFIGTIPCNTFSQILIPYSSNIPYRIKHRTPHSGFRDLDFLFWRIETIPEGKHRIECNLDLVKHLDLEIPKTAGPSISPVNKDREKADQLLRQCHYEENKITVGFHPGCNPKASFKRWSVENYAALGNYLQKNWDVQIVIVGGKDELDDVDKIISSLKVKPINVAGRCSLGETAAVIERCRFFVSNDSGIMHLATAVGVPVFAIFGPKDERHIGPYGPRHTVMRNGREVSRVSVEQVIETLLKSEYGLKNIIKKKTN